MVKLATLPLYSGTKALNWLLRVAEIGSYKSFKDIHLTSNCCKLSNNIRVRLTKFVFMKWAGRSSRHHLTAQLLYMP